MSTADKLVGALNAAVDQCIFAVYHGQQQVPAQTLRDAYLQNLEGITGRSLNPVPLISEDSTELRALVVALREVLSDNLDDEGRIGDGLVFLMGGVQDPPIGEYAKRLIRAGAVLGPARVIELLEGWIAGDPLRFLSLYVLINNAGGSGHDPVRIIDGVEMSALPLSTRDILLRFPYLCDMSVRLRDLLGRILLEVECEAVVPALYRPGAVDNHGGGGRPVADGFDVGRFCEAISLAENRTVDWSLAWQHYGELREFGQTGGYTERVGLGFGDETTLLRSETLRQKALEIYGQRERMRHAQNRLETSIHRWLRSIQGHGDDAFIDLRIALEALYAGEGQSEMRFRTSTHGALHLGSGYADRKRYRDLIKKVYDRASRIVHAGALRFTPEMSDLLTDGQAACREGILKCLASGSEVDLDRLMFGSDR